MPLFLELTILFIFLALFFTAMAFATHTKWAEILMDTFGVLSVMPIIITAMYNALIEIKYPFIPTIFDGDLYNAWLTLVIIGLAVIVIALIVIKADLKPKTS